MHCEELAKAIRMIGSQQKLAKELSVSRYTINHWLNRDNAVPIKNALSIEMLTVGKVRAENLVPKAKKEIEAFKNYLVNKER